MIMHLSTREVQEVRAWNEKEAAQQLGWAEGEYSIVKMADKR